MTSALEVHFRCPITVPLPNPKIECSIRVIRTYKVPDSLTTKHFPNNLLHVPPKPSVGQRVEDGVGKGVDVDAREC